MTSDDAADYNGYTWIYMGKVMRGRVSKWGNSLALRLPAEYVKATGLRVGDSVELEATARGELRIVPSKPFDMEAFLAGLRKSRASMPITESVVEQMRRDARY